MRTERRPPIYIPVLVLFLLLLAACEEKPDFIGRELLPSADDFTVLFDSAEIIYGYTRPADSIRASYKETHLIGFLREPLMGTSKAELVTTLASSSNSREFGPNAVVDSVVLALEWLEFIGEGNQPFQVNIYEMTERISYDSNYYTNWDLTGYYKPTPIGTGTVSPDDTTVAIQITDAEFINKFLFAPDSVLSDWEELQKNIYGLYITLEDPGDEGGIYNFNFDQGDNFLRFFYHNDTAQDQGQSYSLDNQLNGKINMFRHDVAGYPIENYINNGSDNDSLIFIQSMAGVNSRIRFPQIEEWMDSMPIAINEARLIIPVADSTITGISSKYICDALDLFLVHPDGSLARVYDAALDQGNFGGTYNAARGRYSFTVKYQLQSILAGNIENLEFQLVSTNTSQRVERVGLYGWNENDSNKRIRLEITYTPL